MGLFDRFKIQWEEEQPHPYEGRWQDDAYWGEAFVPIEQIYQAFENANLGDNDIVSFMFESTNSDAYGEIGGSEGIIYSVTGLDRLSYPTIKFEPNGDHPAYYGELLEFLQSVGDNYGWDNVYRISKIYYKRNKEDYTATPFNLSISVDPYDVHRFIISGSHWFNDTDGFGGIGAAAGL